MLELGLRAAHRLVAEQQALGVDCEWDGWDMVFYRTADHAMHSVNGCFRKGAWAFENRVAVNNDGKWLVDKRNLATRR